MSVPRFPGGPRALLLLLAAAMLPAAEPLRLITLDPGHFHAALVQREMLPGISPEVAVYAPLGPNLLAHLNRIAGFNARPSNPTSWRTRVYAAPDFLPRLLAEPPGAIVVLSGNNRGKIERVQKLVSAGFHGLIDKPWIIEQHDFAALAQVLDDASRRQVILFDAMTERYEITRLLQKALVNNEPVFGRQLPGSPEHPGVEMDSVHYLLKLVAGAPNLRPPSFFDPKQQGEALSDVGTHLVDLVHWTLFPNQLLDYRHDLRLLHASTWPTLLSREQLQRVTGEPNLPADLLAALQPGGLHYECNNSLLYTARGVHVRMKLEWLFEAPPGSGDRVRSIFYGSRSSIALLQDREQNFRPEIYILPNRPQDLAAVAQAARRLLASSPDWAGIEVTEDAQRLRLVIPDRYRIGHEAHFSILLDKFLGYVRNPASLPSWEKPNMLAKYYVTTAGVALAHHSAPGKPTQ